MKNSTILKAVGLFALAAIASLAPAADAAQQEMAPAGATGDAEKGAAIFKAKCGFCHAIKAGAHKMGPSMAGIYGMKAGTTDYDRYLGLTDADFEWNDETLDGFLKNPREFLGRGTTMPTAIRSARDRAHLIAYLKTL